jgi:hypothetical protein
MVGSTANSSAVERPRMTSVAAARSEEQTVRREVVPALHKSTAAPRLVNALARLLADAAAPSLL